MLASMLADTLDVQELRTGRRQEGIFAAALAFSGKATGGVGALIAGFCSSASSTGRSRSILAISIRRWS